MEDNNFQVSDLGEKKLIERIIEKSKKNNQSHNFSNNFDVKEAIGDDAALINVDINFKEKNSYLVSTSDLLIEKYHFPKQMSYFQMGWKGVTVNVSDLAAMASKPLGILISLAIPSSLKLSNFDDLIDGILDACSFYNIPLIGGDTNQSEEIIISGTALGKAKKDEILSKDGFESGDLICITGKIGLAALGLEILKSEYSISTVKSFIEDDKSSNEILNLAIDAILSPIARINEGILLGNFANSATDITDGLASELHEILNLKKSNNQNNDLGMMIFEKNLPSFNEIAKISKIIKKNPLDLILHVGEDFELLFTISKDNLSKLSKSNENFNYYLIGEINNRNKVEIEYSNGAIETLSSKGFNHLK